MKNNKEMLENLIKRYSYEYYVLSNPTISDVEFDKLYDRLKEEFPDSEVLKNVGNDLTEGFPKGTHLMTMGSQEKIKTKDQLKSWISKNTNEHIIAQYKLDGISVELQYENGKFISAITRGNGTIGDNITSNVLKMKGIKTTFKTKNMQNFSGSIRSEILMSWKTFNDKYKDKGFSNPRNLASGMAKNKTGDNCEDLEIVCYEIVSIEDEFNKKELQSVLQVAQILFYNGFLSVEHMTPSCFYMTLDDILDYADFIKDLKENNRVKYPIDGLVFKQNIIDYKDMKELRPKTQRAFKWEEKTMTTVLREVEWSRSGVTYTPIAIFDEIELEGTKVNRASLANESLIKELDLHIGDTISVSKRNMIIPKIEEVILRSFTQEEIKPPKYCELCGHELIREEKRCYCGNSGCSGLNQHRIAKWIHTLDVKGFGESLLTYLYDNNFNNISDLYDINKVNKAEKNTNLKENFRKSFKNLYVIKEIPLEKFLGGFDLEGIGTRIIKNLVDAGYDSLNKICELKSDDIKDIPMFGEGRSIKFVEELNKVKEDLTKLISLSNAPKIAIIKKEIVKDNKLDGRYICITGKLETGTRKDLIKIIERNGGIFSSGVSKTTNILVMNDINSTSSKAKKARQLNINIITENDLLNLVK